MTSRISYSIFFALYSVIFMAIFSFTLPIMAGVYIVSDLGGSTDIAIYGVCFYGLGNALGIPLGRSLANKFGTVKMLGFCLHLFSIFSLLCGLSANFPIFIGLRLIQGIFAGPFYSLCNQLFATITPTDRKELFTTIFLTIFSVTPVLGACWGGWIAYDFNWRLIFIINVPIITLLAWYIGTRLKGVQPIIPEHKLDVVGYLFFCIGIFCLSFVAILGQELDWLRSPLVNTFVVTGIVSLIFFYIWTTHHPYPLLEFSLFKSPLFTFGIINLMLLFSAYFGIVVLLALWLTIDVKYTPMWIGLLLSIMAGCGIVPAILSHRTLSKINPRIPLLLALICLAVSSFHTTIFNEYIDFERIAFSRILAGFGLVFFLPALFRLCFHAFEETHALKVVEIFQIVRALSSSVGVALYTTLWQRREVFFHERMGSSLTLFSPQTQEYFANAKAFHISGLNADAQLNDFLDKVSTALALDDCFYLMGWLMVGLIVFMGLDLLRQNRKAV